MHSEMEDLNQASWQFDQFSEGNNVGSQRQNTLQILRLSLSDVQVEDINQK